MRGGFDRDRRIAARQRQELVLIQGKIIGFFKCRQRIRPFDKFRRRRQFKSAALFQITAEIGKRGEFIFFRDVLAYRDGPGVICRRRRQPDQLILLRIQFFDFLKALLCIFPCRIVFIFKKERPVTGVFRIDIQLSGGNRATNDWRRPELNFIDRFNAVAFQYLQNHVAEQRAFGINL